MAKTEKTVYVSELRKPTNWRWERARELSEQRKKGGVRFLTMIVTSEAVRYLNKKKAALRAMISLRSSHTSMKLMLFIQKLLLIVGLSKHSLLPVRTIERIVAYTGASEDLISTYEKLFFDVRSRLKNPGFINMRVLGNNMREVGSTDPDGMWKILGYNGGPQILYALWSCKLPDDKIIQWFKGMRKWEIIQGSARAAKAESPMASTLAKSLMAL
jgi:hypothetical protein